MASAPIATHHRPVSHQEIVQALIKTLSFRRIRVIKQEYAVSPDGMRCSAYLIWQLAVQKSIDLATEEYIYESRIEKF
jgi:hypothetical protein